MAWLDPLSWDWSTLVKTAIGAGVGTATVQAALAIYRDHRQRKVQAAYMAMRLAVTLEAYASACSGFIATNAEAEIPDDEEFPNWSTQLPDLPPYPDDTDGWRAIRRTLAGRCLNFRNKIHGSQEIIYATAEYARDDLGDVLNVEAAERGLEAWTLAVALRRDSKIEAADTVWDYATGLEHTLERAKKAMNESREQNAKFAREMFGPTNDA